MPVLRPRTASPLEMTLKETIGKDKEIKKETKRKAEKRTLSDVGNKARGRGRPKKKRSKQEEGPGEDGSENQLVPLSINCTDSCEDSGIGSEEMGRSLKILIKLSPNPLENHAHIVDNEDDKPKRKCNKVSPLQIDISSRPIGKSKSPKTSPNTAKSAKKRATPPKDEGKKKRGRRSVGKKADLNVSESAWRPEGAPFGKRVWVNNDSSYSWEKCYSSAVHSLALETIRERSTVMVLNEEGGSGIAMITAIYEDRCTGNLMAALLYYYTKKQVAPELNCGDQEVLASRHMDSVPLDTIQEKVHVLTHQEYMRYCAENRCDELHPLAQPWECDSLWPRGEEAYARRARIPEEGVPADIVFYCHRLYEFQRKTVKAKPVKVGLGKWTLTEETPERKTTTDK